MVKWLISVLVMLVTRGYNTKHEKVHGFFPFNKPDLLAKWIKFVNRSDWKPTDI